ncbi:hypothetical protein JTB14_030497 [Gonioctena quinquepunctata]|nr:hypothetical protein JTB14_030497 [Gonioctena quinquepunctata]
MNMEVYTGAQPAGLCKRSNKSGVVRITEPIHNSSRNITMYDWFSSIPSAPLLPNNELRILGTLCKNKAEIAPEFFTLRKPYLRSMFGFTEEIK